MLRQSPSAPASPALLCLKVTPAPPYIYIYICANVDGGDDADEAGGGDGHGE